MITLTKAQPMNWPEYPDTSDGWVTDAAICPDCGGDIRVFIRPTRKHNKYTVSWPAHCRCDNCGAHYYLQPEMLQTRNSAHQDT
jgi:hypothetical protein